MARVKRKLSSCNAPSSTVAVSKDVYPDAPEPSPYPIDQELVELRYVLDLDGMKAVWLESEQVVQVGAKRNKSEDPEYQKRSYLSYSTAGKIKGRWVTYLCRSLV